MTRQRGDDTLGFDQWWNEDRDGPYPLDLSPIATITDLMSYRRKKADDALAEAKRRHPSSRPIDSAESTIATGPVRILHPYPHRTHPHPSGDDAA